MAQQTLDFVIASQVTGNKEIARLIKQVGALDKEMQRLKSATQSAGAGFNQATKGITQTTNGFVDQAKAARRSQLGIQQAGMQINDFATQVSTGGNVVTAFNNRSDN